MNKGGARTELPVQDTLDQIVGYLNFSSGNGDAKFLANLNSIFAVAMAEHNSDTATACQPGDEVSNSIGLQIVGKVNGYLLNRLEQLEQENETYRDTRQSRMAIELTLQRLLPIYRDFHQDQLFHQSDEVLFNSFFVGRAFETVLGQILTLGDSALDATGESEDETSRAKFIDEQVIRPAIESLNDFIGHRPVAVLESQKIEPYSHEWVRPIPLYVREAGIAQGRYREIVEIALTTLRETHKDILLAAHFDPDRVEELAIDPRAFDFDHPINKRPNHHFGQWDEHRINQHGFYDRFLIHQVTLDALLSRVERDSKSGELNKSEPIDRDELMAEAGAVLAGTILMASGISGSGPAAHSSTVTLGALLPMIASYRDQFYAQLIDRLPSEHRQRLRQESRIRHQPFGAARQDLNAQLAQRRASQLVNCRLASIFARMGYPEEAEKQSQIVPVAGARIICQIDCMLSSITQSFGRDQLGRVKGTEASRKLTVDDCLEQAAEKLPKVFALLKRGIECGAIVDPWNILGFDANYSLFPAVENSVRDHRAYELVELVERILAVYSRLWSEAAANDRLDICEKIKIQFRTMTDWWRKYAAHEVMAVDAVDAEDIFGAAELVAKALNLWHKGGAAAGDIGFWSQHADLFDSPKAYALVIDALMQRSDFKTSTALLVHWLSQADAIPLQQGDSSFHQLVFRWITEQRELLSNSSDVNEPETIWKRIRKFYDFVEANAEHYWEVPQFQLNRGGGIDPRGVETQQILDEIYDEEEDSGEDELFRAAYEDVVYHDTTDDGMDGSIFDASLSSDDALEAEVDRVLDRLEFQATIANYWQVAATVPLPIIDQDNPCEKICARLKHRRDIFSNWVSQALSNRRKLIELLQSVHQYPLSCTGADTDSLFEYDRHRLFKESLLERAIETCVETENAVRMLLAVVRAVNHLIDDTPLDKPASITVNESQGDQTPMVTVFSAVLLRDPKLVVDHFAPLVEYLNDQALLYVPLSKGGDPAAIVNARVIQTALLDLLSSLPSLGLLIETHELTVTALAMERNHPIRQGAVTEFDELFQVAYTSMVHSLIEATDMMKQNLLEVGEDTEQNVILECENVLFDSVEMLTETMLILWLDHSRTLRLSVLEKVVDKVSWDRLVEFIERYGDGLFTQQFLHLANVRAILHQGVNLWFDQVLDSPRRPDLRLLDELDHKLPRQKAIRYFTLVLEAVIENYNEYRDYNTTTTQSDQGSLVYILLDFLRLRSRYERVCWNLKPVVWAHEILVRDAENGVARMWRRSLTERVGPEADKYLGRLEELRDKYSVRMESIGRRLEERFGHPMQIDRLRALVGPAMRDPTDKGSRRTFELLQHEAQTFSRTTMGVGVDLPGWLAALEKEVQQQELPELWRNHSHEPDLIDPIIVSISDLKEQLEQLPRRHK